MDIDITKYNSTENPFPKFLDIKAATLKDDMIKIL